MQHRAAHRALSVFLAIVMVFTCNSATFQLLVAYADEEASQTPLPEVSQEEAVVDESVEASVDEGEGLPGESGQEGTAGAPDEPPASNDVTQTPREADDMTEVAEAVLVDFAGVSYVDADGTERKADAAGSIVDLSALDAKTLDGVELRYRLTLQPGNLTAGDTIKVVVPRRFFSLNADKLAEANAAAAAQMTVEAQDGAAVATLTQAVADAEEPVELELRIPVALAPDALGGEPTEAELPLQGERTATVVLPAKALTPKVSGSTAIRGMADLLASARTGVKDVKLEKEWRDNNDANRPWEAIAADGTLNVYFTLDGVKQKLDEGTKGQLGLTSIPAITAQASGVSRTTYSCTGLPAAFNGKNVEYSIEEDADKALDHGYVQQMKDGLLYNVKATSFTANVIVRDGGLNKDPGNVFSLSSEVDDSPVAGGVTSWTFDPATGKGAYTVTGLPAYNLDGKPLSYYAKAPESADTIQDYYYPEYDNVAVPNHGTDVDAGFDGGTISLTLAGQTRFEGTKAWLDDGNAEHRPEVTLYLWRYTDRDGNGFAQASQVRDDAHAPVKVDIVRDDKKWDTYSFAIDTATFPNLSSLPKYDAEGYPYVYLMREVMGASDVPYEQVLGKVIEHDDGTFEVEDTLPNGVTRTASDKSLYNGGTISNRRTGSVTEAKKKTWKTSTYQNQIKDAVVTLSLQSRPAGSTDEQAWKNTGTAQELTGFISEIMTQEVSASAPKYDERGRQLEYRWVETSVKEGGEELLQPDGSFLLACNEKENAADLNASERFVSSDEPIDANDPSKGTWIVNRITGVVDYTVDKVWRQLDEHGNPLSDADGNPVYDKKPPESGAAITVGLYQDGTLYEKYKMDGAIDEFETEPYRLHITGLPKYDDEGRLYRYVAEEVQGYGSWHSTYTHEIAKRLTNIKNDPTGPGAMIRVQKTWIDDSDIDHRYPVTVNVYKKGQIDQAGLVGSATLDPENNWWDWVGVPEGTTYDDYEIREVVLTASDGTQYVPNDTDHPGMTTVTTDQHIYRVTYGKDDALKMLTVTNKRIGVIDLTVTKKWVDKGNEDYRPEADLVLSCDEYPDAVQSDPQGNGVVKLPDGNSLPILDDKGQPVKAVQTVRNGSGDTESTYCFFNLPKYDQTGKVIHYSVKEVPKDDAAFAAGDYVISVNRKDYHVGNTHTNDKQSFEVVNRRSATKSIQFHKEWLDVYANENQKRPDIYLTLWKKDSASTAAHPVTKFDFIDHLWQARVHPDGSPIDSAYHWTATFDNMPKYDETGGEITYYAQEDMSANASGFDYVGVRYKDPSGSLVAAPDGKNVVEAKNDEGGTAATVLVENGTFVNGIENKVVIEGRKLWTSIPEGYPLAQLPKVKMHLDQKIGTDMVQEDIAVTDQLTQVGDTNEFTFSIKKAGLNDVGGDLPKYDDQGRLYTYELREEITGSPGSAGITWDKLYNPVSTVFSIENVFQTGPDNNGSLKVLKQWAGQSEGKAYPAVTFNLYRWHDEGGNYVQEKDVLASKVLSPPSSANASGEMVFENLLVYAPDGSKYGYTVEEAPIDGYTTAGSGTQRIELTVGEVGSAVLAGTFTNTYDQPGAVSLTGKKQWKDYGNAFKVRPNTVDLELTRSAPAQPGQNNSIASESVALTEGVNLTWTKNGDTWEYKVTGLDRYAPNGMPWVYHVKEKAVPDGYYGMSDKTASQQSVDASGNVTMNQLTNGFAKEAKVVKKWVDNDNEYDLRPKTVTVKLQVKKSGESTWNDADGYANFSGILGFSEIELSKANAWSASVANLPPAKSDGGITTLYEYRFVETRIGDYADISVDDAGTYTVGSSAYQPSGMTSGDTTTITNTMVEEGKVSLEVCKSWEGDQKNLYGTRPMNEEGEWEITFDLQRKLAEEGYGDWVDVRKVSNPQETVQLKMTGPADEFDRKTLVFDNLPKYDENGKEYVYRPVEHRIGGYQEPAYYDHGANVTSIANYLKTTKVTVTKEWVDDGLEWTNEGSHRPDSIELVLYRQAGSGPLEEVAEAPQPKWINDNTNYWTGTYEGLPATDKNDEAYTYTVKERSVPDGYWASYSADGLHITNTQTAFGLDKLDTETGKPVNDVQLTVFDTSGTTPLVTWSRSAGGAVSVAPLPGAPTVSTGENGKILGLPVGDYVLRETRTPGAYVTAGDIPFSLKTNGALSSTTPGAVMGDASSGFVLIMEDRLARAGVELTKSVAGGTGTVAGVEFALYRDDGTPVKENLVTDRDGKLRVDGLEVGKYYFKETKATPDTVLDTKEHPFEVTNGKDGTTIPVNVENKPFAASLELAKIDGTSGEALAGAAFTLTYTPEGGGEPRDISVPAVPGSTGTYRVDDLKKGEYTLEETTVPNGYADAFKASFTLDDADNGKPVVIKDGAPGVKKEAGVWTAEGVANTRILGSMELTKRTEDDAPLNGAEFTLERNDEGTWTKVGAYLTGKAYDAPDATAVAGKEGTLLVGGLAWGAYRIVETKAPDGFQAGANPEPFPFQVGPDSGTDVKLTWNAGIIKNAQTRISVDKVDDATPAERLAGAKLKLAGKFADGTAEWSWESAADAAQAFEKLLVVGETYTLVELDRLPGYLPLPGSVAFTVNDAGQIVLQKNPTFGDGSTAASLSSDGGLLSVRNVKIAGSVELTKTDEGSVPLKDVVFDLYREGEGAPMQAGLKTDAAGKLKVEGLAEGSYYFVETATNDDMVLDPDTHVEFSVGPDQHATVVPVSMENARFSTSISLRKADATSGEALEGVGFTLYKQERGAFVPVGGQKLTASDGGLDFDLTSRGTYRIRETAAAEGYLLDADNAYTATFTVDNTAAFQGAELKLGEGVSAEDQAKYGLTVENAQYKNGRIANERKLGAAMLSKVDADVADAPLNGVAFDLFREDGTLVGTYLTGQRYPSANDEAPVDAADGQLVVEGLGWGSYYFQEAAAEGYVVSSEKLPFAIDARNAGKDPAEAGTDLGVIENRQTELSFSKTELYNELCSDPLLGAESPAATRPLAGAEFTAFVDEGCATVARTAAGADAVATSGPDGRVTFKNLPGGATYYVKETKTPAGHVADDAVYVAVFAADGTLSGFARQGSSDAVDAIVNDVLRIDISIKKVSENDHSKVLPGSTYGLFKLAPEPEPLALTPSALAAPLARSDSAGLQLVAKATTDENGVLTFKGVLMNQEYVVQELVAPDGSLVSKHPITMTFEAGDDGVPKLVRFDDGSGTAFVDADGNIVWREPQVVVEFSKKDVEGRLLAGAKLQVVDANGTAVGEPWTSAAHAAHRMEGVLKAGETYRLVELEAPEGYLKAADVEFTVDDPALGPDEGYVQSVEMVDERVPESPESPGAPGTPTKPFTPWSLTKTGDGLLGWVLGLGVVALGAAGLGGAALLRRRKQRS